MNFHKLKFFYFNIMQYILKYIRNKKKLFLLNITIFFKNSIQRIYKQFNKIN